ncbi:MAG: hypothetical protein AABN33_06950 [Acidobacteriota bacterium]
MNSRRARSLADYSRAARRRKLALLIPALVLAIATGVALRKLPNLYESTASMEITPSKIDGGTDLTGRLNGFRQHVTSREALEAVISTCKRQFEDGRVQVLRADVKKFLKGKANPEENAFLRPGDTVVVHGSLFKTFTKLSSVVGVTSLVTFMSRGGR